MHRIQSRTISNAPVADQCYRLVFEYPQDLPPPLPGQFLTLRVTEGNSPLLRRPFAFSGHDPVSGQAEIIYERRGSATRLMTAFRPGDELDIIGPIGNAFPVPAKDQPVFAAGGGIGIGPILFQYHSLKAKELDVRLVLGARTAQRLPLGLLPTDALISTDDGSKGFKGNIVQALEAGLGTTALHLPVFQLCGPHVMMKNLGAWARRAYADSKVHVSMEQTMACAVGACMGCVIQVKHDKTYARVCSEGPVFDYDFVVWD